MIRALFDLFQITESQLTRGAQLRLRAAGILGLFSLPLGVAKIKQHGAINFTQFENWIDYAFVLAVLGFVIVAMTRAVNRLFIPDNYLDESEIVRKRHINGTVFYIIMTIAVMLLGVVLFYALSGANLSLNLKNVHMIAMFMMGVFVPICCLQGLVLSFIVKPLDGEGVSMSMRAQDYKYLVLTISFVVVCTALAVGIGR